MKFLLNILIIFSTCNLFAHDSTLVSISTPNICCNNKGALNPNDWGHFMGKYKVEEDSLKVDFKVEKTKATKTKKAKILYIEQVVEDSTGVITTTRIPIKDSLVAVNFIQINLAKIDSTSKQIDVELDRLNQMTDIIRQQNEQIRQQRQALIDRRSVDNKTRRELILLRRKL